MCYVLGEALNEPVNHLYLGLLEVCLQSHRGLPLRLKLGWSMISLLQIVI